MTRGFTPRVDILPLPQRRLWDESVVVPVAFVLCGDTAWALHLGHRESVDFDFLAASRWIRRGWFRRCRFWLGLW